MTAVADVRKEQIDMLHQGEHQTLTKQSMRHQVCSGETCHTIISESAMTMLMSRGQVMYNYYLTAINPKSYFFKQTNIKDNSKMCI